MQISGLVGVALTASLVGGAGTVFAPAAAAVEPIATTEQGTGSNPIRVTGMNWVDDTTAIYRVKNTFGEPVTGTFRVMSGAAPQARTLTVPANGEVFVAFDGTRGKFQQVKFDGPGKWDKTQNINNQLATGHVDIVVTADGETAAVPVGFAVTATSSIEEIVWTWDGDSFETTGDLAGYLGDYVYESQQANGLPEGYGRLDTPMTESYSITHGELPEGVTVAIETDPGTIPAFDDDSATDAEYVDAWGRYWWTEHGKYLHNAVVVTGSTTEVDPTDPPTVVLPETSQPNPEVPPTTQPPTQEPSPQVPAMQPQQTLPKTGGSLTLTGIAAALIAAGGALSAAARRRNA